MIGVLCALFCYNCNNEGNSNDEGGLSNQVLFPEQSDCLYYTIDENSIDKASQNQDTKTLLDEKDEEPSLLDESITVIYADDQISIDHHNACKLCNFSFVGNFNKNDNEIEVVENSDHQEQADCMCFFNINYTVPIENEQTIQLIILDDEGNIVIDEELDLTSQAEFEFNLGENGCPIMAVE